MKILILGGDGMLGHKMFKYMAPNHDVRVTLRQELSFYASHGLFDSNNAYTGTDVSNIDNIKNIIEEFSPEAVVNAIGIIKQRPSNQDIELNIEVNALFPRKLAIICRKAGSRMLHMSTDCVFSGKKGNYKETDLPDAADLYGKTKYLGEVAEDNCLTLRTSIIGRELSRKQSLFEWFLSQEGSVKGFKKAIFSGFTTIEISRVVERILIDYPDKNGMYHVSSDPINKYDLLLLFRKHLKKQIEIEPDDTFICDRSLDSSKFRTEFKYNPPTWDKMVSELINSQY